MNAILKPLSLTALVFAAAVFGFFYAWVCSTMWGLDAADPRVAIPAMQAMNASVRNAVFALGFFGTTPVLVLTAVVALLSGARASALGFAVAAVMTVLSIVLTTTYNVPMNEALAALDVPADRAEAEAIWTAYSPEWQYWNTVRTVISGIGVVAAGWALLRLPHSARS